MPTASITGPTSTPPPTRITGVYRAYGLLVATIADNRITAVTGFDASVLPRFGLPRTLAHVRP